MNDKDPMLISQGYMGSKITEEIMMKYQKLEQNWFIAKDENNIGKAENWEREIQPSAINACVPSIIQQFYPEYHGVAYYWCHFKPDISVGENERILLRFGGVDYLADVWLNSIYLGTYEGAETPFSFDITEIINLKEENLIGIRIVNPCDRDIDGFNIRNIPSRNKVTKKQAGWNLNFGGILYNVTLSVVPKICIEDTFLVGDIDTGNIKIQISTFSKAKRNCEATLTVNVYENNSFSDKIISKHINTVIETGMCSLEDMITIPEFKLWSVEDPHLYRVELSLVTQFGEHKISIKFGFREFCVKKGFFYLNRKRIFLKSAHSGNAFPVGQMFPTHPEQLRKDFIYAKAAGFNMIRAIAGLFRPEQLDIADEIGLLIYDECFASWCLGNSQLETWNNAEEYEAVSKKYPEFPLGDENTLLRRWRSATEKMILRDRNHPSVVVWGFLNETMNNGVFRCAYDFLERARELDPSRFIVLNSGRFDYDLTIGSASNPYTTKWENTWGTDGHPELFDKKRPNETVGDSHFYAHVPFKENNINHYRTFGTTMPLPVFQSEFGIGSLFHVIEEWKQFLQYGERRDLEDASWLEYQSQAFEKDFYRFGVDKLFAFPESLLKESQRINAEDRKRIFDILRSNPRLAGYSLTGLLDHGMCGEGLWSYWRRWKPEMFDTISDGFSPLRFSLFAEPTVFSGEKFTIEATLANEGILKSGEYTADFAIISDTGVVQRFTKKFTLLEEDFVTSVMKEEILLNVPEGKYSLIATLREAVVAGNSTDFFVFDKPKAIKNNKSLFAFGFVEDELNYLKRFVSNIKDYNGEREGIVLVGNVNENDIRSLLETAEHGMKVFFLDMRTFLADENASALRALASDMVFKRYTNWLYHKEFALLSRDIFDGIDDRLATFTKFGQVFSHHVFMTEKTPDYVLCPGFLTGYHNVDMGYASMHSMLGFNYGQGEVYLNSFNLIDQPDHPVANKILYNIIKYLIK